MSPAGDVSGWRPAPLDHAVADPPTQVLPSYGEDTIQSAIPPAEVTKVALRLHHLIEEVVPCEMEELQITKPHSRVITHQVIQAAKEAGGEEYRACVVRQTPVE